MTTTKKKTITCCLDTETCYQKAWGDYSKFNIALTKKKPNGDPVYWSGKQVIVYGLGFIYRNWKQ